VKCIIRKILKIRPVRKRLEKLMKTKPVRVTMTLLHNNYNSDGMITTHTCKFIEDKDFARAYKAAEKATGLKLHAEWRTHTVLWAARQCITLDGDFVECGVNRGFFSRAIIEYLDFSKSKKMFYLLDTFEGMPTGYATTEEKKINDPEKWKYDNVYNYVKKTFKKYKNVRIIKGEVPGTLKSVRTGKVAYLSLDMNSMKPEIAAAEYFWDKIVPGGIIVLDDYAYDIMYEEQRKAFDRFAKERNTQVLTLATGQGLIIKR
jgi:O-methyltransferase